MHRFKNKDFSMNDYIYSVICDAVFAIKKAKEINQRAITT